jgi:two-component system invasion response regulator UvrY
MKKRILIVDDHPQVVDSLCKTFSDHDYFEVCGQASTGQEAIEKARILYPHLVILDLAIPEMNGLKTANAISKILPDTPIILFTLYAQNIKDSNMDVSAITRIVAKGELDALMANAEDLVPAA